MRKQAGQTLLEILVAFSISVLVLGAIVVGVTTSLSSTQYAKNQGLANSYAQEGMAAVKHIRDSGVNLSSSYTEGTAYCIGDGSIELEDPFGQGCEIFAPVAEIFSREVEFDHDSSGKCSVETGSANGSEVIVRVSWSDSKCPSGSSVYCHSVELISCIFDLDQIQSL